MRLDEKWIYEHLPEDCADEPIDVFSGYYLDGLTVMAEGERGGEDKVVYRAKNEDDLRYWQLEKICGFAGKADHSKKWRYLRDHAEDGVWYYIEHRHYNYNAIEDPRLPGFERFLRNLKYGFPRDRWEAKVKERIKLMNFWYTVPHWDYDRDKLCFVEISDSREHDDQTMIEEPRPGSVIRIVD
ncbi:MAG: hypothetical protein J5827_01140 [Oscillospiraceae bacterium]|nr:hypothetical protein [Oscillospiraceae bacterium]